MAGECARREPRMDVEVRTLDATMGAPPDAPHHGREHRPQPVPPRAGGWPFATLFWLLLFDIGAFGLLAVALFHGWVQQVFAGDVTGLTWAIAGIFLAGLALSFATAWKICSESECVRSNNLCVGSWASSYTEGIRGRSAGSRAISATNLRYKVAARLAPLRYVAGSLVLLGLIGTVLGFIIALSGVSAESASNLADTSAMISRLIAGMSVALYTTLEGAILNLWLTAHVQILATGAAALVNGLVALGEWNERARSDPR